MRKTAALLLSLMLASAGLWAQGLNTPPGVTKDDWEEINFEFNSSVLVDGFPSLLRLGELLQKNPGYKVQVEGHTDVIGGKAYNDKLGLARANAVRDFLVKYGAAPNQITVTSNGKDDPRYPGQKSTYQKTDEARWMNRRVSLTVTDAEGKTVSAGSPGEAIRAIQQPTPAINQDCCNDILKRLDKLDDIAKMLKDLGDQNADLRKQIADLKAAQDAMKQGQQVLESKVNEAPKGPTANEVASEVTKELQANKHQNFQLLGVNIGADDSGNTTFTGKGRYFSPFGEHYGFEAQAEYLYYHNQQEGQFDVGLVDRLRSNIEAGLFGSFKHVSLREDQNGGTLGEAALTIDYLFSRGKLGFFGTKGFKNDALVNTVNATDPRTGALLNDIFLQSYLHIVDQAGLNATIGLWKNVYAEGNIGYLHSEANGNRVGGTARFIFPLNNKVAFTVEGGLNETLLAPSNSGRAAVGLQFSNMIRPKEYMQTTQAVPVDPPRVRYEVITKRVRTGNDAPVADAGPNQANVPAGTIQLDGSGSYDPDGDPITYQWVEEVGPVVTLSDPTSARPTFTATQGQTYTFRLIVTDSLGAKGVARVMISTQASVPVAIGFFNANPTAIIAGQSATLSWNISNATSVTISGIGPVPNVGTAQVSPTTTTTYTLTAVGTNTLTATAVVVVNPIQTKVQYCYANPTNIHTGESATLNWATINATNVSIQPSIGAVAANGNVAVSPTQTTTYTITATGPNGGTGGPSTDTCSVTVSVTAGDLPRIIRFSSVPATIYSGQKSTLLWVVENATKVSIDNGVGASVSLGATQDVSPAATTTYTITATNAAGSVTATAVVNVIQVPPPVITSLSATPNPSPKAGSELQVTCATTGAARLTINGADFLPSNPTWTVFPTQTTTYTCTAYGFGGQSVSKSITVVVP